MPIVSYKNAFPTILIGIDNSHVGFVNQARKDHDMNDPVVVHTKLGWIIYGRTCAEDGGNENRNTVLTISEKNNLEILNNLINEYYE